jgi:hypothetical protein
MSIAKPMSDRKMFARFTMPALSMLAVILLGIFLLSTPEGVTIQNIFAAVLIAIGAIGSTAWLILMYSEIKQWVDREYTIDLDSMTNGNSQGS